MHNLNVTIVDCSYVFRLLESNHHQVVYREYRKEIIFALFTKSVSCVLLAPFVLRQDFGV